MKRRDFIAKTATAGLGLTLMPALLQSCQKEDDWIVNFSGKVLIIGAGAAGMMAAYYLNQHGVDFELIEASTTFGGRVKKTDTFVDFSLDLGAEWLHDTPDTLGELLGKNKGAGEVKMVSYQPESIKSWNGSTLVNNNIGAQFYREYKFKNTTWYDFFEDFVVPSIADKMHFEKVVASIDYTADEMVVTTIDGNVFKGDKVIVTVPVAVLKQDVIEFKPSLPEATKSAIEAISVPPGIKVFIKFKERFYPDLFSMDEGRDKLYFDGAFKKESKDNLLTLFYVAESASELTNLTNQEIIDTVIAELDGIFDGQASLHYESHIVENWSENTFIRGAYSFTGSGPIADVDQKIYFAGEAFIDGPSSTVHGAGFSGRDTARQILEGN